MNAARRILLCSERETADRLVERLGDGVCRTADPYEGLRLMAEGPWPVVVLDTEPDDIEALCRAARKLQGDARLYAICDPPGEPDAMRLAGSVIDDYFIEPPSREDIVRMRRDAGLKVDEPRASAGPSADRTAETSPERTGDGEPGELLLGPRDVALLIAAATSPASLEARLAEFMRARTGVACTWADADDPALRVFPLLYMGGDVPRALVGEDESAAESEDIRRLIEDVQDLLPALADNARRMEGLHRLAITDHLTGAYNRRQFYLLGDQILRRVGRENRRATLLLYDIDDFKRYNDTYGYAAGDEILRETASLVRRVTRSHDVVARIGGDEFAVLFWERGRPRSADSHPPDSASVLVDRFRRALRNHSFALLGPDACGALTISGGLASFPDDGCTVRELLHSADTALKDAKRAGKNRVHLVGADE